MSNCSYYSILTDEGQNHCMKRLQVPLDAEKFVQSCNCPSCPINRQTKLVPVKQKCIYTNLKKNLICRCTNSTGTVTNNLSEEKNQENILGHLETSVKTICNCESAVSDEQEKHGELILNKELLSNETAYDFVANINLKKTFKCTCTCEENIFSGDSDTNADGVKISKDLDAEKQTKHGECIGICAITNLQDEKFDECVYYDCVYMDYLLSSCDNKKESEAEAKSYCIYDSCFCKEIPPTQDVESATKISDGIKSKITSPPCDEQINCSGCTFETCKSSAFTTLNKNCSCNDDSIKSYSTKGHGCIAADNSLQICTAALESNLQDILSYNGRIKSDGSGEASSACKIESTLVKTPISRSSMRSSGCLALSYFEDSAKYIFKMSNSEESARHTLIIQSQIKPLSCNISANRSVSQENICFERSLSADINEIISEKNKPTTEGNIITTRECNIRKQLISYNYHKNDNTEGESRDSDREEGSSRSSSRSSSTTGSRDSIKSDSLGRECKPTLSSDSVTASMSQGLAYTGTQKGGKRNIDIKGKPKIDRRIIPAIKKSSGNLRRNSTLKTVRQPVLDSESTNLFVRPKRSAHFSNEVLVRIIDSDSLYDLLSNLTTDGQERRGEEIKSSDEVENPSRVQHEQSIEGETDVLGRISDEKCEVDANSVCSCDDVLPGCSGYRQTDSSTETHECCTFARMLKRGNSNLVNRTNNKDDDGDDDDDAEDDDGSYTN